MWDGRERGWYTVCKTKESDQKPGGREGLGTRLSLIWRGGGGVCVKVLS